jgi:ATP-dependent exoDNAse (exonuclease V) beta subunit
VVYVIHVSDGILPSDMATGDADQIEEERRLLYVACTRARQHLYVLRPLRYYAKGRRGDAHIYSQLTRFIPRELNSCFQLDRRARGAPNPRSQHQSASRTSRNRSAGSGNRVSTATRTVRRQIANDVKSNARIRMFVAYASDAKTVPARFRTPSLQWNILKIEGGFMCRRYTGLLRVVWPVRREAAQA